MKQFINFYTKQLCLLALAIICAFTISFAQNKDSKGTDFWLMFTDNFLGGSEVTLFISGDANTSGTVTIPGLGFSQDFTVTVGDVTSIPLPSSVNAAFSNVIENKGVHVVSKKEVTVYGLSRITATTDAFLGLPTDVLGTEYINLGYLNSNVVNGTQFGIVSTQNNTKVTITPTLETDGHPAGVAYTITMDQGETYLLRNTGSAPNDLTGTIIKSDNPIAVFGGHQCANIPPGAFACDYVVEELPPTNTWGKEFVTVPLKTRLNGDTYRFLASDNNTHISVNGSPVATLDRAESHEMIIDGSSVITSDKPILVAQYSNGTSYDNVTSDPFMMLISPFEQFLGDYTVTTPASGFGGNYINVVAPNAAVGSIRLDGVVIPASHFTPIGTSGYSGAQEDIGLGVHTINGTTQRFGVFVYGFDNADSYGYPGGQAFAKITEIQNLTLTPASGTADVNTNQCFTALIQNQNNQPVVGVPVDFKILGANGGTTGSGVTDGDGKAQFCYDGPNEGEDTIVATQGSLSDTSFFTRTQGTENKAPYFVYPPTPVDGHTINAHPGEYITFMIEAKDNDSGDEVTLTADGLPAGASTSPSLPANGNPVSTKFMWTPGAGDVGTYPITFTAKDNDGKTKTTTVIVQVTSVSCNDTSFRPFVYVYPVFTVANQAYHTIYKGYGTQTVCLVAVPRGGTGNPLRFDYKWDDGSRRPLRRVSPEETTTYYVDITDGNGCTARASITVYVVDVRCGNNMDKVQLCIANRTLCVAPAKVDALIKGGAKLGSCDMLQPAAPLASAARAAAPEAAKAAPATTFVVYPNPAVSTIRFKWDASTGSNTKINILDLQGRVLITQTMAAAGQSINVGKLPGGVYMAQLMVNGRQMGLTRFTVSK